MLSGGGNENREKNTIGLISKKQLCTCNTLFFYILCHRFGRLQPETSRNFLVTRFMEEISYVFLFTFFSTAGSHFHLGGPLAFSLILLPPLQNFHLAVPIALFFFISRSSSLSLFSRWASLACRLLSLFLCLSLSLFSNLWTWKLI